MTAIVTIPRLDAGEQGIFEDVRVEVNYDLARNGRRDRGGGWIEPESPAVIYDWTILSSIVSDDPGNLETWIDTHEELFVERLFDALDGGRQLSICAECWGKINER